MRRKVEFPTEEEDASSVVVEAAEAACIGLYGLDFRVEALGEGIRDRMLEVGEKIDQVGLERLATALTLGSWLRMTVRYHWVKKGSSGFLVAR